MIRAIWTKVRQLGLALVLFAGWGVSSVYGEEIGYDRAALLAASCFNCHGTDGRFGGGHIPDIAGRPASVLFAQLMAFQRDEIPDATVMNRLARGYTEAELEALARYFASIGKDR